MRESKLLFTSGSGNPCVSPLSYFQGLGAGSPLGGVCVFLGTTQAGMGRCQAQHQKL